MRNIKKCTNLHIRNSSFILMLVPMFLIISSSIYPAIISGIQNKEMALVASAAAQLQEKNNRGDSSGYHANIPVSDMARNSPSPTPTTAAPSSTVTTAIATANNNKDFTTQAALGSPTARPTNNIVNTNSFYDVVFLAATSGAIKTIRITFPAGTVIPSTAFFNEAEKCVSGTSCTELTGTASKSGQTITYTVNTAVNVPAGTKIRLEFANINNPLNPSPSYKVTVTTRGPPPANAIIDGPTQSAVYTIKQIGANAIANNAITDAKLSLDSVYTVWDDNTVANPTSPEIFYRRIATSIDQGGDLSNNAGSSSSPATAASGNNVYVVWADDSLVNREILYRRSTDGGFSFGSTVNLSNNAGASNIPAIAASGNSVYVVWSDSTSGNFEIFYRISTDGGATFGGTNNLSLNSGTSSFEAIAVSGNNVYVVWQDDTPGNDEIFYRRSTDGGANFGTTINLSNNAGNSIVPAVAASGNNVYVMWEDNTPGNFEILYRRSTNGGATFGSTINLSNNAGNSIVPAVAASGNNVYVMWNDNTPGNFEILYRRSTNGGATFGSTINLSNNAGSSFNSVVAASGNNVYVVWQDLSLGNDEILYRKSTDEGSNFGSTVNLSNNPGTSSDPAVASINNLPI